MKRVPLKLLVLQVLVMIHLFSMAGVSPEEAATLKTELTPFGAERAGNKDGSIPSWDGGYTQVWDGYQSGQLRPDPFSEEKPLFQITGKNMDQYADKLSDGMRALLQRFPTFRLDVYPTHRTAAAPQWVYENTFKNAINAKAVNRGMTVKDAYGGIPFPIPKNGAEAMWNHLLTWRGETLDAGFSDYVINGPPVLAAAGTLAFQYPYYRKDGSIERFEGVYARAKKTTNAPPSRTGETLLVYESLGQNNAERKAWQYVVGQRRVRRAPIAGYDTPNFSSSGLNVFDEIRLFNGVLDRYEWKLLGKKEMFIPYNTNSFHWKKIDQVLGPQHINPDHVRWELHRVWVVEAQLASGERHVIPKRRFYLDEDTWLAMVADGWDAKGELWHVSYVLPIVAPDLPGVVVFPFMVYDLQKGAYQAASLFNESPPQYESVSHRPDSYFSPEAMAGEGVR